MPAARVLLVSPADLAGSEQAVRAARAMRDTGAEVVLLPDAPIAAIVAAAMQEAVDTVYCQGPRIAELTAAMQSEEMDVVVATTESAGRREP